MMQITRSLSFAALAAAAMYWFDPNSGRRRRAQARDKLISRAIDFSEGVGVAWRDLLHRSRGFRARIRAMFESETPSDEVLIERIRANIGHAISHPGVIEVEVSQGRAILSGPVLADEYNRLLHAVRSVRGIKDVEDRLAVYESAEGVSALQGGRPRPPQRFELLQENWSPAARLVTGTLGTALMLYGLRERGIVGSLAAVAGGALTLRSTTNMPLVRLSGASGHRAIDIQKTIHVNAPIERVFETLARHENFPAFMRNVREVHMYGDGRSHWVVAGPAGTSVEWDAETTAYQPNKVLAWRTVPNSKVEHAGIIRFQPDGDGTRLDIRMSYNPPAGAVGHVVAKLFGTDPKKEMDEDLMRLKTYLETGVPPRDAAIRREKREKEMAAQSTGRRSGSRKETEEQPHAQPGL